MRRYLVVLMTLILLVLVAPVSAQERSFYWDRWDVVIDNIDTSSNSFTVEEHYTITFKGTFRFGSRLLPVERVNRITDVNVTADGERLENACSETPGTMCARNASDGLSVIYYFPEPVTNRSVDVTIEYTVHGGLRAYEGGDQLWWYAVAPEHAAPIYESVVIVNMPEGAIPREGVDPVVTYGAATEVDVCREMGTCAGVQVSNYLGSVDGAVVVARTTEQVAVNEPLEIRVQYPHTGEMVTPAWQPAFDRERTLVPYVNIFAFIVTALLGIGLPLGIFSLYWTRGRDPHVGPVPEYLSEPPSDLPPAVAGTLVDERADLQDVLSTLIDLAKRGYIVFDEERSDGLIFGIGASKTITLKRTSKDTSKLKDYERKIIRKIFGRKDEKELEDLKYKFYAYVNELKKDLYGELVTEQFFTRSPETTRGIWMMLGIVMLFLGVGGFIFAASDEIDFVASSALMFIPGALAFAGLITLLFSNFMPAKTREGALEAAKWNAFKTYLQNLEQYDTVEAAADKFDAYLPYAVAFGLEKVWIRTFSRSNVFVPIPGWYYPRYLGGPYNRGYTAGSAPPSELPSHGDLLPGDLVGSGGGDFSLDNMADSFGSGLESISDSLTSMLNSTSSVLTSKPSSSGGWSGGGSSFSGGGSFGGGGGGGGSAGFG